MMMMFLLIKRKFNYLCFEIIQTYKLKTDCIKKQQQKNDLNILIASTLCKETLLKAIKNINTFRCL